MTVGSLAGPEIAPQNVGNGQSRYSSKKHQGETLQHAPAKVHLETDLTAVPNTVMIGFLSQEQSMARILLVFPIMFTSPVRLGDS